MKRLPVSVSMLAVLLSTLGPARPARADAGDAPAAIVKTTLMDPLAARERDQGRFSRARQPPHERRVRLDDKHATKDASGAAFYAFAVDVRYGIGVGDENNDSGWRRDAIEGCVYTGTGEVFVKVGDKTQPAALLLGKRVKPAAKGTCEAAGVQVAVTK